MIEIQLEGGGGVYAKIFLKKERSPSPSIQSLYVYSVAGFDFL